MDLSAATELYLLERARVPLFLVPDSAGTPTVIHPQPLLFRATYLSAHDLETETGIQRAGSELEKSNCPLFAPMPCPDGPPYRTGLLFVHTKRMNGVPWQDGSMIRHGDAMLLYQPTTMQAQWDWIGDARMGRYGYFLTGTVGDSSLWRLFRLESDAFFRSIFTLAPVLLAAGCPQADFTSLTDPTLKVELTAQYTDFCRSVTTHSYRQAVTTARNIVEGILWARLGESGGRDLFAHLKAIKKVLENGKDTSGWTELEYHLAHKIRLAHARTHATQAVKVGRGLTPAFALSAAEDLIELLRIWGYCKA